ncbi:MAG: tetratricopeptide repeat protein, partial [bacterium]
MSDPMIFVGREKERETIHQLIAERDRAIICVKGPSKMGKTHLMKKIHDELAEEPNLFSTTHQFRSTLEDALFPFVVSLGELISVADAKEGAVDKARRLVQALAAEPQKAALRLAGAASRAARAGILSQVQEYFQSEEFMVEGASILEETIQEAGKDAELDELLAQARPAVISSYLGLLENLSDHADPEDRFVFIFDQMEHAPELALEFLMTMVHELPPKCVLLFSMNIEHPRGSEIWSNKQSEFGAHDVEVMNVGPFGQDEIQALVRARGKVVPSLDLLHEAEQATGGRPLSLDDWIQSEDFDRGTIRKDKKFGAYQLERLEACTHEASIFARSLALLPQPLGLGFKDYATLLKTSTVEVEEWLKELVGQHLFSQAGGQYWFVHEEVQETILNDMDQAVKEEVAEDLIVGLKAIHPELIEEPSPYSLLAASVLPCTDDHETTFELNSRWGRFFYSISEFTAAWEHYKRALKAAESLGDRQMQSYCFNQLGLVFNFWGRPNEALDHYREALTIDSEVGDQAGEATTLDNMGMVYLDIGQQEKAIDHFQQVLSILREVGDRAGEATTLNNIGLVYSALGQQETALEYFEQALLILREVGDRAGEATTLDNMGMVYLDIGQQEKAIDHFQQILPILKEVGDRDGKATTLNNIGGIYHTLGQEETALEYYQQALPILREVGDRAGEATALNNIGMIYSALGQKDKALEYYEQALPLCREVGERAGEAATLNNIGEVYSALGQHEKAQEYYVQALTICREVGYRGGEATTLNNIGRVYDALGQEEKALEYYQQA